MAHLRLFLPVLLTLLDEPSSGVVVEQVARASAAEKAGIQAGDVIASWSRAAAPPASPQDARGRVESPFDLSGVELEQVPRGPVTLAGKRGPSEMTWALSPAPLGLSVRPVLPDSLLAPYEETRRLVESGKREAGAESWRAAAGDAKKEGRALLAAWLLAKAAGALAEAKSWTAADTAYEEAIAAAEAGAPPAVVAHLLREWAGTFLGRNDWDRADDRNRRALAIDERLGSESLPVAQSRHNLGVTAWNRRDLPVAEDHLRRALAIRERLAPRSLPLALTLNNLGNVVWSQGDFAATEDCYSRALAIRERLVPGSLEVATSLNNLGVLSRSRGDLVSAEDYQRRALAIREALAPGSLDLAQSLHNLGVIAFMRRDFDRSAEYYRRSLAIKEKLLPESLNTAVSLNNLGLVAQVQGDLAAAEDYFRRALAIREKVAPGNLEVAPTLYNLGEVAMERGNLDAAEEYLGRALSMRERLAPGTLQAAESLGGMGELKSLRGDATAAETYYRRALAIREKLAHGSADEAESLRDIGLIRRRMGRNDEASVFLLRALESLETQKRRLGGTGDVQGEYAAKYAPYYHDALETLVELNRPAEALHVLERSRARLLLAMLAERDLLLSADLPPELARERRSTDVEYDRVQAEMARLDSGKDDAEIQRLQGRLRELLEKQEEVASRVRRASPRLASLQYPQPLDLAGVRDALDPGTVFVAYSVGADRTILFTVQPPSTPGSGLSAFSLPVGEKALRQRVEAFRKAIQRPMEQDRAALIGPAAELYDLLIRPAEGEISAARRLLISPDGPLHSLPFAALARKAAGRAPSYLVEWKPLHVANSATLYAQLKKSRRRETASPFRLVAFGDPRYPPLSSSKEPAAPLEDPAVRSVSRDFTLTLLPHTREEVTSIAGLFPHARKYLGEEATEERAKSLGTDTRYVHFACHGYLDERFPLNSALALTIPERRAEGQDNGLLQAWEIFDKVRLDADLVTLSACKTGLGKEMGGEGLQGLTRAFHYAGARSVLATLWAVSDRSTPLLMKRFYGQLKAGRSRDEALRAAQIDLIRAGSSRGSVDLAHPFRWAGFQLSGDWQ
jgi:CHAT domain-containing protein/Tfp pilus assembly protein PilF